MKKDILIFENEIIDQINSIADYLKNNYNQVGEYNLSEGKAGIALFFLFYSDVFPNQELRAKGVECLAECINEGSSNCNIYTLYGGWAGINFVTEQYRKKNLLSEKTANIFSNIDKLICQHMIENIRKGNYDLLHGAIGEGLYLLKKDKLKYKSEILELVYYLNKLAIKENNTIKWAFYSKGKVAEGVYNLGLSHGIPSIISFLLRVYNSDIEKEISSQLILGGISFLLESKFAISKHDSYFPYSIDLKNHINKRPSRLAWCYGDLGVAITLWDAFEVMGPKYLSDIALEVILNSTKRKNLIENLVFDACLCHGTAGIAHIFSKFYEKTRISEFRDAKLFWIKETLKMANYKDGCAGYKYFQPNLGLVKRIGYLEGIAGIGLALISSISQIKPYWDESLLLS